jgi:hypothetical protein
MDQNITVSEVVDSYDKINDLVNQKKDYQQGLKIIVKNLNELKVEKVGPYYKYDMDKVEKKFTKRPISMINLDENVLDSSDLERLLPKQWLMYVQPVISILDRFVGTLIDVGLYWNELFPNDLTREDKQKFQELLQETRVVRLNYYRRVDASVPTHLNAINYLQSIHEYLERYLEVDINPCHELLSMIRTWDGRSIDI